MRLIRGRSSMNVLVGWRGRGRRWRIGLREGGFFRFDGKDDIFGKGRSMEGGMILEAGFEGDDALELVDPHEPTGDEPEPSEPDLLGPVLVEGASAFPVLGGRREEQAGVWGQGRVGGRPSPGLSAGICGCVLGFLADWGRWWVGGERQGIGARSRGLGRKGNGRRREISSKVDERLEDKLGEPFLIPRRM